MKCQRCGTEMGDGNLYCPSCGQEVQIVPNFEPEVEHTISQAMDHILSDVFRKDDKGMKSSGGQKEAEKSQSGKKHFFRWIILLLGISFVVLLSVFAYMNYTSDYQIRRGNFYLKRKEYTEAMKHYEKAEKIDPDNTGIPLYLAECYEAMDKMAGYEASLTRVIQNDNASEVHLKIAYTRLANLYLENNEYQKIAKLLKTCEDVEVMDKFGMYRAQLPKFSHEDGEYSDIVPLKIIGDQKGTIYYSTDGSDQTIESKIYTSPIFLYKGEHNIKAIYVNEFGVVSDVITGKFIIKF